MRFALIALIAVSAQNLQSALTAFNVPCAFHVPLAHIACGALGVPTMKAFLTLRICNNLIK